MDFVILILLLNGCHIALSFHRVIYEYHIVQLEKTWWEARQYCREHYTDLATFRDMDDIDSFKRPSWFTTLAWIGLYDDPASWNRVMANDSNSWRWSATGTTSPGGYHVWWSGRPDYYMATSSCGYTRNGLWGDGWCGPPYPFVCFNGTVGGPKQYTYISTTKSWTNAQSYCRKHYTDLAMIETESENNAVASVLAPDVWVFIGFYRQPWRWSDGTDSQFKNWQTDQPNNVGGNEHCVSENNDHEWKDAPCSQQLKFICHKALRNRKHQFAVKLQSVVSLSDSTFSMEMTKKLMEMLRDKGLTDLNIKWKAPPQKLEKKKTSSNNSCLTF